MDLTSENYFEYKKTDMGVPVLSSSFLKGATPLKAGKTWRPGSHLSALYSLQPAFELDELKKGVM
jgi:hypothetical protein